MKVNLKELLFETIMIYIIYDIGKSRTDILIKIILLEIFTVLWVLSIMNKEEKRFTNTNCITETYNNGKYAISTQSGIEHGIFFRNPIQKVYFDLYFYYEDNPFSVYSGPDYIERLENPLRRLYEILIGNKEVINNIEDYLKDENCSGFKANILCSPIYFKRAYRATKVISCDTSNIVKGIYSYGYESEFETVAGGCEVEETKITLRNAKSIKYRMTKKYHYTYSHVMKNLLDRMEDRYE